MMPQCSQDATLNRKFVMISLTQNKRKRCNCVTTARKQARNTNLWGSTGVDVFFSWSSLTDPWEQIIKLDIQDWLIIVNLLVCSKTSQWPYHRLQEAECYSSSSFYLEFQSFQSRGRNQSRCQRWAIKNLTDDAALLATLSYILHVLIGSLIKIFYPTCESNWP